MKKIIAVTFLTLLFSCKPIIFPYKPVGNSDLVKEGEFYYLTTTNGKIGYYPRVWINPKAGIECDIKLENIEIDSIEKIDVFNENTDKIIEITKDSIRHLFNPELNQINLTPAPQSLLTWRKNRTRKDKASRNNERRIYNKRSGKDTLYNCNRSRLDVFKQSSMSNYDKY